MRMTPLSTRHVENASTRRKSKELDEARHLLTITLEREERAVLEKVVGVESGFPPLLRFLQKKTGSRYAPNTVSIAARISYSVQ
jgi:hypothetical protein